MLITIFGESCTGKSTLADKIHQAIGGEIITGNDYLRFAKNKDEARKVFAAKLNDALTGNALIYVVTEKDLLSLVPQGSIRILVSADLATIKERFKERMHGNLPAPVAAMLEKKHGLFNNEPFDIHVENGTPSVSEVLAMIKNT